MIEIEKIKEKVKRIILDFSTKEIILFEIAKLLREEVYHYDWVGFYILDESKNELYLGPYVGAKTDHLFIQVGKGICGQVAQNNISMVVQDVSKMENYLSCSINVQSEIVVPIKKDGKFIAELDIDSHSPAPFTDEDNQLLEFICFMISPLF
jgi:L-methionine (R)-S-oxide reductase